MKININESLLKKKHRKPIRKEGKGRGGVPVPYGARYEVTMELQCLSGKVKGC